MTIFAVVLAGGEGSRLGMVRKADLRLGGRTMLDRVAEPLAACDQPVLVATGPGAATETTHGISVPDLPGTLAGPLAGLAAAVAHLRGSAAPGDAVVSVAVDTPFLPADFVERLSTALNDRPAVYSAWGDGFYPTNAAYRLDAISHLPEEAAEIGSPRRLLESLAAARVDWTEPADDPFANLNTLADLAALTRRTE